NLNILCFTLDLSPYTDVSLNSELFTYFMNAHIIAELQSLGLRTEADLLKRSGGAGPAQGGTLLIGGRPVTVPVGMGFVVHSSYSLQNTGGQLRLFKEDQDLCPVELLERPHFYDLHTTEGISYPQIALRHGTDCLATTILQTCANWRDGRACRFCGIEVSLHNQQTLIQKNPEQMAEVAQIARDLDGIKHVLLTVGRDSIPEGELSHLALCASAVKKRTGLPIQAQFLPPRNLEGLERLQDSGVDSVGIHIESFDFPVLSHQAPYKSALGLKAFVPAWKRAVTLFGPNQVSSFLIVGLGETDESVIRGADFLTDLGVYPFIVPFRPIPGSLMEKVRPPEPEKMIALYQSVAELLKQKGLLMARQKAGCVRCGACSAMAFFEQETSTLTCHPTWRPEELDQAYAIRQQVFVREQHLFEETDQDDNDLKSLHLVTERAGQVTGTVRVFPNGGNGHWIGGRLAIRKEDRKSGAGELLVREAV
ncbi:MAG: MSMEG_0568 family radical SAM protein, partial [Desulfobacca sp.]|nr:MSMEG_0568 family radical SAM protein [Desulfobacca sp.]